MLVSMTGVFHPLPTVSTAEVCHPTIDRLNGLISQVGLNVWSITSATDRLNSSRGRAAYLQGEVNDDEEDRKIDNSLSTPSQPLRRSFNIKAKRSTTKTKKKKTEKPQGGGKTVSGHGAVSSVSPGCCGRIVHMYVAWCD